MRRLIELGINPAEHHRAEIQVRAEAERRELFVGFAGRLKNGLTEKVLPTGRKLLTVGLRHAAGVGSLVEAAELLRNQNFVTGKKLSPNEMALRVAGVSFEVLAIGLFVYAAQQGEGQKMWQDLQAGFQDAHTNMHFYQLFEALKAVVTNPQAQMAATLESISMGAGHLQEVVTLGSVFKSYADKLELAQIGGFLSRAFEVLSKNAIGYEG